MNEASKCTDTSATVSDAESWDLKLYIAGQTPKSVTAYSNLKKLCDELLQGRYTLEIVDLQKNPQLANADQIVAIPTLIRKLPEPIRRIIGDLSNRERTLKGLDLHVSIKNMPG